MLALLSSGIAGDALAAGQSSRWSETKCARYMAAWTTLMNKRGAAGLGPAFLNSHDAFMASGCRSETDVCPRSAAELDVANIMVIAAMNAGAASTFPPFRCAR